MVNMPAKGLVPRGSAKALTVMLGLLLPIAPAVGEHLSQTTSETRTVLYFKVADEVLKTRLPQGWEPVPFDAGPAKGANLTLNLSEQLTAVDAHGNVAGDARGRGVTLSARVRNPATGKPCAMVLFGLTNGADTPGPYGTHLPAVIGLSHRETDAGSAVVIDDAWTAKGPNGDRIDVAFAFQRGDMASSHLEQQTRSSLHPDFYRIYKMDLISDVVESDALHVDRLKSLTIALGGVPEQILGKSPKPVAVTSVPIYRRAIWLPD